MKKYYQDENGACYMVGTTNSYQDEITMREYEGDDLQEVEPPENFDANRYNEFTW